MCRSSSSEIRHRRIPADTGPKPPGFAVIKYGVSLHWEIPVARMFSAAGLEFEHIKACQHILFTFCEGKAAVLCVLLPAGRSTRCRDPILKGYSSSGQCMEERGHYAILCRFGQKRMGSRLLTVSLFIEARVMRISARNALLCRARKRCQFTDRRSAIVASFSVGVPGIEQESGASAVSSECILT